MAIVMAVALPSSVILSPSQYICYDIQGVPRYDSTKCNPSSDLPSWASWPLQQCGDCHFGVVTEFWSYDRLPDLVE